MLVFRSVIESGLGELFLWGLRGGMGRIGGEGVEFGFGELDGH